MVFLGGRAVSYERGTTVKVVRLGVSAVTRSGAGCRVQGSGCRVFRVQGLGFRFQGAGYRVEETGDRVHVGLGVTV